ncbi:hypothetical protein GMORB2_6986 [Geosmithia morbida]|uniref:Uncharacterized protein n=1 Tax=Geosmithia morbida TaxID=1094350 RepID=A0A9P4YVR5_9HYPO|nr:uncharacterized protein GMORB2_6986 [Geosmithia morbida]KAF4122679.1 hypothetical protein GMORB2_6986 [Geosmithia morbida]
MPTATATAATAVAPPLSVACSLCLSYLATSSPAARPDPDTSRAISYRIIQGIEMGRESDILVRVDA